MTMSTWTNEDISAILTQLNSMSLPFTDYTLLTDSKKPVLLGKGASANVYRAYKKNIRQGFAVKVIGFKNEHIDSDEFINTVCAQLYLGKNDSNVVKIYDYAEVNVWIEDINTVVRAKKLKKDEEYADNDRNCLRLQFVLMEELAPVIETNRLGIPRLYPYELQSFDENEILNLAYDIGIAIKCAHDENIIHRDIKLENIFYDAGRARYKLGDFGIAKSTDDGMASTVAFTKGYGAPEVVGTIYDRYDKTADIYSLGMILYVLLNKLRFPASNGYHPNVMQYTKDFTPKNPLIGNERLSRVVLRMISFNPDDRYQTMDDVLNELDGLKYGMEIKYQREQKKTAFVMGAVFSLLGMILLQLSFYPKVQFNFSIGVYLYIFLCIGKLPVGAFKYGFKYINILIICSGIFVALSTGGLAWKILLLLLLPIFCDMLSGVFAAEFLFARFIFLAAENQADILAQFSDFRWLCITLLSLSVILLYYNYVLNERAFIFTKLYLIKNYYWIIATVCYTALLVYSKNFDVAGNRHFALGTFFHKYLVNSDPILVGIAGTSFCLIWLAREAFMILIEKNKNYGDGRHRIFL